MRFYSTVFKIPTVIPVQRDEDGIVCSPLHLYRASSSFSANSSEHTQISARGQGDPRNKEFHFLSAPERPKVPFLCWQCQISPSTAEHQGTELLPGQEGAAGGWKHSLATVPRAGKNHLQPWRGLREGELCSGLQGLHTSFLICLAARAGDLSQSHPGSFYSMTFLFASCKVLGARVLFCISD